MTWTPRREPLLATAAVARGAAARRLVHRLLTRDDTQLAQLTGVASDDLVLVLGPLSELPWTDGVLYLGKEPGAAELMLPTTLCPSVPRGLLCRAMLATQVAPPVAVLPDPPTLISLAQALPLSQRALLDWAGTSAVP